MPRSRPRSSRSPFYGSPLDCCSENMSPGTLAGTALKSVPLAPSVFIGGGGPAGHEYLVPFPFAVRGTGVGHMPAGVSLDAPPTGAMNALSRHESRAIKH